MLEKNDKVGDYTLIQFLGKGQFGEVWLAEKRLQFANRTFRHALKFLSNISNEIDLQSAEAEIDTWVEASGHPNVMSVLDMFAFESHIIIVSEYAEGGSLKSWLKKMGGKAPSPEKAIKMMLGILSGIEHLHSRNVVHRDLKPDNILLQGNYPRITDFGISRIVANDSLLTKVVGSPAYMSPESFDGNKSHQTDIWSAGVIFYELLSGKLPFHAETIFGLARAIRQSEPDPLPHTVHEGLMRFIDTALQKDLTMRFQTARDMRIALDTVANELKADLRVRADVTEKFSDLARYIDPAAVTEVIDGASAQEVINQTSSMDIAEDPMGPVQSISIETQRSMIDITGDDPSNDKDRMTSSEGARALIPPSGKPTASKRVLWITAIAGGVLVPVVGLGLLAASFSNFFMPAADNAQVGPENPAQALVKRNACGNESDTPKGMVCIPGGEFMMGRDNGEMEEEGPAFPKSVEPFYMDVHEVTNAKYAEFVQATQHDPPEGWQGTSYPNGQGNLPVVNVNWYDASKYAEWAGKRLPTEKEWEFAARGPDNRLYTWGNEWRPGFANIAMLDGAVEDVSKFADGKSPFGMLNMIGNAGEWTADDFKPYPRGKLPDRYKGQNDLKTLRGNNFGGLKEYATATFRFGYPASGAPTYDTTGFRCAKDAGRKGN